MALLLSAALVFFLKVSPASGQGPTSPRLVPAPTEWIALTADYVQTSQSGAVVGRYWRDTSGSTRLESGVERGRPLVIDIKNIPLERWYQFDVANGWTEQPLRLGGAYMPGQQPAQRFDTVPARTFEGMPALQRTTPDGLMQMVVPALNFLVVDLVLPGGSRTSLRNVQRGIHVDPSLFLPEPGAALKHTAEPGGIVIYRGHELEDLPGGRRQAQ